MIKKMITATVLATAITAGGVATAQAGVEATSEVPRWMTRVCEWEGMNNCHYDAGDKSEWSYMVRKLPNRNLICVFYIDHPREDYCYRD